MSDKPMDLDAIERAYDALTRGKGITHPGANPETGRPDGWRIEYDWGSLECSNAMAANALAEVLRAVPQLIALSGEALSVRAWQKQTEERQAKALEDGTIPNYFKD